MSVNTTVATYVYDPTFIKNLFNNQQVNDNVTNLVNNYFSMKNLAYNSNNQFKMSIGTKMVRPQISSNIEEYVKKINVNLNKLSKSNYESLSDELAKMEFNDLKSLEKLAELVCEKAYIDHSYTDLYVKLLCKLSKERKQTKVIGHDGIEKVITLKHLVLHKCCDNLLKDFNIRSKIPTSLTDEEDIFIEYGKHKKRYVGIINLITQMYINNYIDINSIIRTIDELIKIIESNKIQENTDTKYDDLYIEFLCELLMRMDTKFKSSTDKYIDDALRSLYKYSRSKPQISSKIRFKIDDLFEVFSPKLTDKILEENS
jgi:hypothetical protein